MPSTDALDPELTAPEVSNRAIRGFVDYLTERFGRVAMDGALAACGLPRSYLEDENGWVSALYMERFVRTMLTMLMGVSGIPDHGHPAWAHWREAGRQSLTRNQPTAVVSLMRAFGSPALIFRRIPAAVTTYNRVTEAWLAEQVPGMSVIRARPRPGASPDLPGYCWNRYGLIEAVPTVWGLPPAEITHTRCIHDRRSPSGLCEYVVRYQERPLAPWIWLVARLGLCAGAGAAAGAFADPSAAAGGAALGGLFGAAVEGWVRQIRARRQYTAQRERFIEAVAEADARYTELWHERAALRRTLLANRKISGYLATDLVDRIMENPEVELGLGGERREAAVLFADIVGFTPRCEASRPEDVIRLLNGYFAHIDPVITEHGGIIDKRLGDGIMVVFPSGGPDGAAPAERRAVACAVAVLRAVDRFNAAQSEAGGEPLQIRAGIAAGELIQGNVGSEARMEYTVIGDVVNLASRLQGSATPGTVLVESGLAAHCPSDAAVSEERVILVRGRESRVAVVEIRPADRR